MKHPIVYDLNLNQAAILENASKIGYTQKANEIWTAQFTLPADDPKNAECQHHRYVEIFDGDERVDLFRIIPTKRQKTGGEKTVTYQLEHVLATLVDDVLFRYHQIGNIGVYTDEVLEYILSHQEIQRWKLGQVDFDRQFEYKWENENLLAALFSVPKPFVDPYLFTWDTTRYPWTLNLIRPSDEVEAYARWGKNLRGITKDSDPTQLCTRLYALGYGEGVNQLDITNVNPTGLPYIDADTQDRYGIVKRIWVDRRYEIEQSLFEAAQAMLEGLKEPRISYQIDGADISRITDDPVDRFQVGNVILIDDEEDGEIRNRVVSVSKSDVNGAPGDVQIEIQNPAADIAQSIADLANRQRINETYAQGATNLNEFDYADNCDATHPAVIKFYIPEDTVRINKMLLSYETEPFRGYSRATKGGGGVVTSTKGGGGVVTSTSSGGGTTATSSSGGGVQRSTASGGGSQQTSGLTGFTGTLTTTFPFGADNMETHTHNVNLAVSQLQHTHTVNIPSHTHNFEVPNHTHQVTIPDHTHQVEIPDHTHEIELPDHTHDIEFGIYEHDTVPSSITVRVDGNEVPGLGTNETDVDIVPYLAKDGGGRIQRGVWHEVTITPNDLGRIVANIHQQIFVQSRGGGDY